MKRSTAPGNAWDLSRIMAGTAVAGWLPAAHGGASSLGFRPSEAAGPGFRDAHIAAALLLLGGDKAGNWQRWNRDNIPLAEQLYLDYTAENEE